MKPLLFVALLAFAGSKGCAHIRATSDQPRLPPDTVEISGPITMTTASSVLDVVEGMKGTTLTVYIDSPGGSYTASELIVEMLQVVTMKGGKVRCFVTKRAYSGAGWIFESGCTDRTMLRGSQLMFHEPYVLTPATSHGIVIDIETAFGIARMLTEESELMAQTIAPVMMITPQEYHKRIKQDWFLSPEDAIINHATDKVIQ